MPFRITKSETQSEESIFVDRIGLEANIPGGNAEDPPDGTISADDGDDPCIVCMERPADAILLECGHGGLCVTCSTVLWDHARHCPLCRQEFAAIMRIVARETRRTVRALCARRTWKRPPRPSLRIARSTARNTASPPRPQARVEPVHYLLCEAGPDHAAAGRVRDVGSAAAREASIAAGAAAMAAAAVPSDAAGIT
jgi:hypothetical protein